MGLFIKGQIPWNKGKQLHYEVWNKGMLMPPRHTSPHTEETKLKCSTAQKERWALGLYKDRKIKYENRKPIKKKGYFKNCIICKKQFYTFRSNPNRKFCSRDCLGEYFTGSNSHCWRGGVTPKKDRMRRCAKYKQWRRTIFVRDDFTCQECGKTHTYVMAHHIQPFSQYPDLIYDLNNGITLCKKCHKKKHIWRKKNVYMDKG